MRAFLAAIRLEQYAEAFDEQGYDDLPFLRRLEEEHLKEICDSVNMKPGHAHKFELKLRGGSIDGSGGIGGGGGRGMVVVHGGYPAWIEAVIQRGFKERRKERRTRADAT